LNNIAAVQDITNGAHLDERMVWVLLSSNTVIASLACIEVGALEALEAGTNNAVAAKIAGSVMCDTSGCTQGSDCWSSRSIRWIHCRHTRVLHRPDVYNHLARGVKRNELMSYGAGSNAIGFIMP
jgi:hypothetical protein